MPEKWMRRALDLAGEAMARGEIPVGAVVVRGGVIIGEGYNRREGDRAVHAHAEILALSDAARHTGDWRLTGAALFVTLEPCAMCAAAIAQARLDAVVFGAFDPAAGCAGSVANLLAPPFAAKRLKIAGGVLREECAALLSGRFGRSPDDFV